jgi:hypothetical protein
VAEQRRSAPYLASFQVTLRAAGNVPPIDRETPGVCGEWSLKDLLGHLAFWDADLADELEAKRNGAPLPTLTEPDWQTINVEQAALRADWSWEQVMTEVQRNHERLVPLLEDPGEGTDDDPIHEHWDEHRAQIEAWLAAQGHWPPKPPMTAEEARDTYLTYVGAVLDTALGIPEALRDEPGVCGDLSLRQLLAHLAWWDDIVVKGLEAKKAGQQRTPDRRGYDVINAEANAARAHLTWDEALAEVTSHRDRLATLLVDPGQSSDYKIYMHWEEHGAQIEAWAATYAQV